MARTTESHRREFEVLRRAFLAEVPGKIRAIRDAAEDAERRGYPPDAVEKLQHLTHRLLGSAAIFGLGTVSDASRALEQQVTALCRPGEIPREGRGRELWGLVQGLESAWSRASRADAPGSFDRDD